MDATIKECMRLLPASAGGPRKLTQDLKVGEVVLPAGACVLMLFVSGGEGRGMSRAFSGVGSTNEGGRRCVLRCLDCVVSGGVDVGACEELWS